MLLDPYSGMDDLSAGVLRTVGDPVERFREDRLRVLRGLRFAARYGLEATADTWSAMVGSVGELGQLSAERVREELMKTLVGLDRPSAGLALYAASGVLGELFPELQRLSDEDVGPDGPSRWERGLLVADSLPRSAPLLRLAGLTTEVVEAQGAEVVAAMLVRLRFSNADADMVAHWSVAQGDVPAAGDGPAAMRRWLSRVEPGARRGALRLVLARARAMRLLGGSDTKEAVAAVRALRAELRKGPPLAVGALAIDGRDVLRLGVPPSPRVGEVLRALLDAVPGRSHAERAGGSAREGSRADRRGDVVSRDSGRDHLDLFGGDAAAGRVRPGPEDRRDVEEPAAPLAARMRPRVIDEFEGQSHLLSDGRAIRSMLEQGTLSSMILWGPPGCGKTTLARLLAEATDTTFVPISAVTSGVAKIREVTAAARERARATGRRTVLFCDEIHRFHKGQQDALLPHVEDGTVVLIGATTENPSFEVVRPLLSRAPVYTCSSRSASRVWSGSSERP